jgi:TolA-binding protein
MSERDPDELDREDLVARARRGLLSPGEDAALARSLERDVTLRTAYRVGVELDRVSAVQGGDDALIARAADAALARATEMTSRTRAELASAQAGGPSGAGERAAGKTRWAVAAAALLSVMCASGIATAVFTGAMRWPFQPAASKASEAAPVRADVNKTKRARRAPPRAEPVQNLAVAEPAPPVPAPLEEKVARKSGASPAERAAELFHAANNARRDGDLPRARRLYAQLIAAHPGSDEAGLSRVSLGRLLLAAGDARGAERELRRYLEAGGGQLREEALVGRAQSLGMLGRVAEERAAWQRLLEAHPSSVYAAQARQRLAALADAEAEDER